MVRPSRVRRRRIRRARQSAIVVTAMIGVSLVFVQAQAKDAHDVGVWVVERTEVPLLGKAAGTAVEASASAVSVGASAERVRVVVLGKVHDVLTNAGSVGELLSAMGIYPDADDRVVPPPSAPLTGPATVVVDRVEVRTLTATLDVPFSVTTSFTNQLGIGDERVLTPGVPGQVDRVIEQVVINGTVVGTRIVSSTLVIPPTTQVSLLGPAGPEGGSLVLPGGARSQTGAATWYDPPWSGLTAAHPWLPKGTDVTVTDVATGRSVTVVIDDRGPFSPGRVIDLSPEAFSVLAPLGRGVLRVSLAW